MRLQLVLAVPLTARDTVVGMLVFARDPGAPAFSRREIATAARLEPRPERRSSTR